MKSIISYIVKSNEWYDNLPPLKHLMIFLSCILLPIVSSLGIAVATENYVYMDIPMNSK